LKDHVVPWNLRKQLMEHAMIILAKDWQKLFEVVDKDPIFITSINWPLSKYKIFFLELLGGIATGFKVVLYARIKFC